MPQASLNQILVQLEMLELDELQQLNQAIQKHIADKQETAKGATFYKALLASGLVKQLKQRSYSRQAERQLIQVQGKPVSETMIEESR